MAIGEADRSREHLISNILVVSIWILLFVGIISENIVFMLPAVPLGLIMLRIVFRDDFRAYKKAVSKKQYYMLMVCMLFFALILCSVTLPLAPHEAVKVYFQSKEGMQVFLLVIAGSMFSMVALLGLMYYMQSMTRKMNKILEKKQSL